MLDASGRARVTVARGRRSSSRRGARSRSGRSTACTAVIAACSRLRGPRQGCVRRSSRSTRIRARSSAMPVAAALDARAAARAARGGGRRGRAGRSASTRRSRALEPETFARDVAACDRRRGRRGRGRLPVRSRPARRPRPARAARLRRAASPARRQRVVESHPQAARRGRRRRMRRELLGRPPEVEGIVVMGDQRGRLLGFPTANLDDAAGAARAGSSGSTPGAALGHRAAISIGTNPHYGGTERARRGLPARLRRRPLRAPARLRALGAAPGRGGVRLGGRADRGDRARRRPDTRGGRARPALTTHAQVCPRRRRLLPYGADCSRPQHRSPCSRASAASSAARSTRSRVAGGTVEKNPGCPSCGYVGWIPVSLPREPQRRAAPPRVGRRSASSHRADPAEVVVPLAASGVPAARAASSSARPSSSTPGLGVHELAGRVHARRGRRRPAARGPRRGSRRLP